MIIIFSRLDLVPWHSRPEPRRRIDDTDLIRQIRLECFVVDGGWPVAINRVRFSTCMSVCVSRMKGDNPWRSARRRAHTQQCHKLPNQILSFPPAYVTQPFSPINVMPQWIAGCIMAIIYYSPSFRLITSECDCFNRVTAMSEPTLLHLSHVYRSLALLRNCVVYFKEVIT